jgi:DNA polymerase III delta subunit
VKPITLLTGKNDILKDEYIKNLLDSFSEDEIFKYYLDEVEVSTIFAEIEGGSLFNHRMVIILKNFSLAKESVKKEVLKRLEEFAIHPYDFCFIILLTDEDEIFLSGENVEIVEFKRAFRKDVIFYAKAKLREANISYEDDVVEYLVDLAMENMEYVQKMLEIIINYGKDKLSIEDLENLFTRVGESSVFDFIDSVFRKEVKRAYQSLCDLKEKGETITQVNYLLYRMAKLMWNYLSTKDEKVLTEKFKVKYFELQKIKNYSKFIDLKFLSRVFELTKEVEIKSKTMSSDFAYLELEKFVLAM